MDTMEVISCVCCQAKQRRTANNSSIQFFKMGNMCTVLIVLGGNFIVVITCSWYFYVFVLFQRTKIR